eukprot:CAMPEP_0204298514 /NCGR_PEP_ID=MMETSP0468-20130131/75126_1 /ASSEMBLY_ACC=CAM_ASM_000383 /TAXON_ID=2969 /ORGANISM="Oxyrrhis marina" /LENGTH=48 /DNA_ID= /DNA_START= /DNA_END= /DNA_ORIENTATION=
MSANWAGVSLLQPLLQTLSMEEMLAGEEGLLTSHREIFAAKRTLLAII